MEVDGFWINSVLGFWVILFQFLYVFVVRWEFLGYRINSVVRSKCLVMGSFFFWNGPVCFFYFFSMEMNHISGKQVGYRDFIPFKFNALQAGMNSQFATDTKSAKPWLPLLGHLEAMWKISSKYHPGGTLFGIFLRSFCRFLGTIFQHQR